MNAIPSVLSRQSIQDSQKETEATLLEAARHMNTNALIEIFDRYSPAVYNYALRLCHDSLMADHVVGDVFARLLDQFSVGAGPNTNLRAYLYEAAYHQIVDESRKFHRETQLEVVEYAPADKYAGAVSLENQILFEMIARAIRNNLTEDQRHVVILRFLEGFSLRETATIIRKNVNYVKVIQNRAIAALRKVLIPTELE